MGKEKVNLLIDGDIIAYQICSRNEIEIRWDTDYHSLHSWPEECVPQFDFYMKNLKERFEADQLVICLSDKDNFRKKIYPDYKANRKDMRKPLALKAVREYISENYLTVIKPSLEADDVLGILSTTELEKIAGKKIIVSIDKDFESIPGWLFNPDKDIAPRKISLEDANFRFYKQVLTGDATDNYPGCFNVGEKTANKILEGLTDEKEIWKAVLKAYQKQGFNEKYAITQARCARILRGEDYDFDNNKIKLWSPKK